MVTINSQLIEIASWRIVSELARRYPDKFTVLEIHPGDGQYNCLVLYTKNRVHIADFNRAGSLHIFRTFDGREVSYGTPIWKNLIASDDLRGILDDMCTRINLKIPFKLPASTKSTIVYRFIAEILTTAAFGVKKWSCKNGMFDSSSEGSMFREDFKKFPKAQKKLKVKHPGDILDEPGYRFWFICINDEPVLCLETTGTAWDRKDNSYDLMEIYKADRKIWSVVHIVAGHLLT